MKKPIVAGSPPFLYENCRAKGRVSVQFLPSLVVIGHVLLILNNMQTNTEALIYRLPLWRITPFLRVSPFVSEDISITVCSNQFISFFLV